MGEEADFDVDRAQEIPWQVQKNRTFWETYSRPYFEAQKEPFEAVWTDARFCTKDHISPEGKDWRNWKGLHQHRTFRQLPPACSTGRLHIEGPPICQVPRAPEFNDQVVAQIEQALLAAQEADLDNINNPIKFGPQKESNMRSVSRLDALQQQIVALSEEVARLKQLPQEPKEANLYPGVQAPPMIFFEKTFNESTIPGVLTEKKYQFVGIKAAGMWYLSGPRLGGKSLTWDQLIQWLENTGPIPTIYSVSKLDVLWDSQEEISDEEAKEGVILGPRDDSDDIPS